VGQFIGGDYAPEGHRAYIADRYPLARRLEMLDEICFGETG